MPDKKCYTLEDDGLVAKTDDTTDMGAFTALATGTILLIPDKDSPLGVALWYGIDPSIPAEERNLVEGLMCKIARYMKVCATMETARLLQEHLRKMGADDAEEKKDSGNDSITKEIEALAEFKKALEMNFKQ